MDDIIAGVLDVKDSYNMSFESRQSLADAVNRLRMSKRFIAMVLQSVEGGGYVVTFSDDDIVSMKMLLGYHDTDETPVREPAQ